MELKNKIIEKLIEGSIGVILLSVVSYFLWRKIELNDQYLRNEIKEIKTNYQRCNSDYNELLYNQVYTFRVSLDKNTEVLNVVNSKIK